ncbi:MAG: glycosyltransferase family 4 protein [Syntrophales bacterium]
MFVLPRRKHVRLKETWYFTGPVNRDAVSGLGFYATMNMRICFISHYSGKGGAERALLETIDALGNLGIESLVMLPHKGPLCEELKNRGISFSILPYRWWMNWKGTPEWKKWKDLILTLAAIFPLVLIIRRWKCDLIYTNTLTICIGAIAARLLRVPHVWHIHEFFGESENNLLFTLGTRFSLKMLDRFSSLCIANSKAAARKYERYVRPGKIIPIYQSVTATGAGPSAGIKNNVFRCVIAGTVCELKGQEDAVRAISDLAAGGRTGFVLDIIGQGDERYFNYLKSIAREYRVEKYVQFHGYMENVFSYIRTADVVLVCSRSEAFGRVTVEGMLAGKPVIGAACAGTAELINDGFNGLLYKAGEHRELAEKIYYLRTNPGHAANMGRCGRNWAQRTFSSESYGRRLLAAIAPLVKKDRPRK